MSGIGYLDFSIADGLGSMMLVIESKIAQNCVKLSFAWFGIAPPPSGPALFAVSFFERMPLLSLLRRILESNRCPLIFRDSNGKFRIVIHFAFNAKAPSMSVNDNVMTEG